MNILQSYCVEACIKFQLMSSRTWNPLAQESGQVGRRNHPASWQGKGQAQPPHLQKQRQLPQHDGKKHRKGLWEELGKELGKELGTRLGKRLGMELGRVR